MSRFERLREQHRDLWERVVEHDFARELGDDSLPLEKFQRYFVQDYAFFQDFVVLIALGIAKAPNMDAARPLAGFLHEILQGEEVLFTKTFESWGWPPERYRGAAPGPTALALGNLMGRTAYEGGFAEILTVLAVTEGTYLDWPARNAARRAAPKTPIYRDWTAVHASPEFEKFVRGLFAALDELALTAEHETRVARLFEVTLRYELDFFDMGYADTPPSGP